MEIEKTLISLSSDSINKLIRRGMNFIARVFFFTFHDLLHLTAASAGDSGGEEELPANGKLDKKKNDKLSRLIRII
jgi:hypothetical protein